MKTLHIYTGADGGKDVDILLSIYPTSTLPLLNIYKHRRIKKVGE
jgi:hypothetical protein